MDAELNMLQAETASFDFGRLTPREKDVFRLLALGLTSREIARQLYLTHNTAREYIQRIYLKAGVNRRSALLSKAMERGCLHVDFYL